VSQVELPTASSVPPPVVNSAEGQLRLEGCWSNSGVYGDGSCIELQKFVHCRNCPVYSAAGVRLIDRPLPPNYRQEWSQHFAKERRFPETGNASVILFRIQEEWLALPTHSFQEVAEKRPIHSLPHLNEKFVLGLANVRGELVICISIGHLLQLDHMASPQLLRASYHRLLVVQSETTRLAFPVDEVHGPHRFHSHELKSLPSTFPRDNSGYARGVISWQERTAGLLDPRLVFSSLDGRPA
jgi:chemotaxis-related protein WspD